MFAMQLILLLSMEWQLLSVQKVQLKNMLIELSSVYSDISPTIGYQNVPNNGYLYYVYDLNRFDNSNLDLENIISELDRINV